MCRGSSLYDLSIICNLAYLVTEHVGELLPFDGIFFAKGTPQLAKDGVV